MSACERYEADLSALLDGELDAAREEELRAHMETCADCRMLYETFSLLHADAQEPPTDLTARIMDAVRAESSDNVIPLPKKKKRQTAWLAAAACFVVMLGAIAIPQLLGQRGTDSAESASVRSMPTAEDTASSEDADLPADNTDSTAPDQDFEAGGALAASASPMAITDADQIETVRKMLSSPAEAEMPGEEDTPVLMLSDNGFWTAIWIDGDDLVYTDNGTQFYRCANAAEALIEYLAQL